MIPDEEASTASEQPAARPSRGHRRSRRGGRRHSRGRRGGGPGAPAGEGVVSASETEHAPGGAEAPETNAPAAPPPRHQHSAQSRVPAVARAIEQVTEVIEELKHALQEMEEVLETLELAERQKIDDEREIESLERALRQLHAPRSSGGQQRR